MMTMKVIGENWESGVFWDEEKSLLFSSISFFELP